jgi:phosphoenolpyruvate carboxykinase (ATP)
LDAIDNVYEESLAPHPMNIIMLSCDAFGVLPPVSKLTIDQAVYHFISGYTAKIPGTELDVKEPIATFSPCFGGPFMPRFIEDYAKLFKKRLEEFNSQCWLINTGWWGGAYGVGKRIDLDITRKILHCCINDSFDDKYFATSDLLNLVFPKYMSNNKEINLDPLDKWHNKDEYEATVKKLNQLYKNNFQNYL